ncbi:hypothetical protein A1Q2_03095 [Trichosporon asahii var. asahii CBS 8904]|uniref:Protein PBN1 n=1 Tax=Trichosporon asahii var. asahii (strain CBS 8904) TaxID=1220162 RepID=K1WNR8_TRIAC|nr:hypothetical protein A1Q2_03095 [Trichosporon asahii var. asahii CBS 8904]
MRLLDTLPLLGLAVTALATEQGIPEDTFHESLTLHPLPDGKLSVLFQFTTHFSLHNNADGERFDLTHYYLNAPYLRLCTENLTPFLSLLPSKGQSGLSKLLARPGNVLSWGFKTEGIHVVMPSEGKQGQWTGWWEGIVDLVPERGGSREFTISSVFKENLPRPFPRASSSILRVIKPNDPNFSIDHTPKREKQQFVDGRYRDIAEWDLKDKSLAGQDIKFSWDGEGNFVYPQIFEPPAITISRAVTDRYAGDGTFHIEIDNHGDEDREALYSEFWPWWVKGWISEMSVRSVSRSGNESDTLHAFNYLPSIPPTSSTTTLRLRLTLPAQSTTTIEVPFTKLMLKYTDHVPDAERGREISSSVLAMLDVRGEEGWGTSRKTGGKPVIGERDELRTARTRIYGPKLLVDIPVPDFSMPYNVIIMSCTIMAIFFGSVHGRLVRKWAWLYDSKGLEVTEEVDVKKDE